MEPLKEKLFTKRQVLSLGSVVFFAVFYLCVWLLVEPRLIYHAFGRLIIDWTPFLTGWRFLLECLAKINGPIVYVSAFLSQCFYFSPIGAIIITAIAWLLWLGCMRILALTKARCPSLPCYLYPALLLVGYASYQHLLLSAISVLAALWFVVLYIRADIKGLTGAAMVFLIAFAFLYYFGGGTAVFFGLLAGFYELTIKGRKRFAILFCVTALAVYYVSTNLFEVPLHIKWYISRPLSRVVTFSLYAMYILPFLVILEIVVYKHVARIKANNPKKHSAKGRASKNSRIWVFTSQVLSFIAPLVLIGLTFSISYAKREKIVLKSDYYSYTKQWQKVLENYQENLGDIYDIFINHDINRALYHTGQLGSRMFSYKQSTKALLLSGVGPGGVPSPPKFAKMIYMLIELGHLADAERLAFEMMETANQSPFVIETLAMINLAKKQNETAKIFLNVLSKDLIHGAAARRLLRQIENDPELISYPPVQHLRSITSQADQTDLSYNADAFFHSLLQKNPKNKMAFEYMLSFYLLTGQLNKFAKNIGRLNDFQYDKIPQHYQEALAVYISSTKGGHVLQDKLSPQTMQTFNRFTANCMSLLAKNGNYKAAKEALKPEFGDTFMFYNIFEMPRVKK